MSATHIPVTPCLARVHIAGMVHAMDSSGNLAAGDASSVVTGLFVGSDFGGLYVENARGGGQQSVTDLSPII